MSNVPAAPLGEKRTVRIQWAPSAAPADPQGARRGPRGPRGRRRRSSTRPRSSSASSSPTPSATPSPLSDGAIRIHWKVKNNVVEVEVSDGGGPTVPRPAPPTTWAPGGRGLRIVRSLAHEWGVIEEPNGRTVWASLGGPSRRRSH